MATSCALPPGCSSAPADLRRISASNTHPPPSQSLGGVPPQLPKILKKFAPPHADPLQCTAWSLPRFRANYRSQQIARRLAREVGLHLRTLMLQTPSPQPTAPSLRPKNCMGILGRHIRLALDLSVATNNTPSPRSPPPPAPSPSATPTRPTANRRS